MFLLFCPSQVALLLACRCVKDFCSSCMTGAETCYDRRPSRRCMWSWKDVQNKIASDAIGKDLTVHHPRESSSAT